MGVTSFILIYIKLIIIFFDFQLMISDFVHTWNVSGVYEVMQPVHAVPMRMGGELSLKYETAMGEKR
jgi:membrane protein CcdC involved in cytochrome C biogenesis